jgi:regulator of sigma E protease
MLRRHMAILVAIVGLGLLIAAHEAGHLLLARLMGMRVEVYSLGFGPRIWGFQSGETEYRLSALPLGGYCKIAGFTAEEPAAQDPNDTGAFMNKPAWRRALVIFAGPGVNYLSAFVLIFGLYVTHGFPNLATDRIEVVPGGPAEAAGLATGDQVTAVDGTPVSGFEGMRHELQKTGVPAERRIDVIRAGEKRTFVVHPASNNTISVGAERVLVRLGAGDALSRAAQDVWTLNAGTLGALWDVVRFKGAANIGGPIAIVQQASQEVKRGLSDFASILANISVGLAVFNLLPVPALDGGRLVFIGGELVTRRKANPRFEQVVNVIGMLFLLTLLLSVVVFNDLGLAKKLFHH